jgi:hypothetical protein
MGSFIAWLFQAVIFAVRISTPWVLRVMWATIKFSLIALASIWSGIPSAADKIATEWQRRAIYAGYPTVWDRQIYFVFYVIALMTIFTGWVILSFITVFIV